MYLTVSHRSIVNNKKVEEQKMGFNGIAQAIT
jgi:hypothetical protein